MVEGTRSFERSLRLAKKKRKNCGEKRKNGEEDEAVEIIRRVGFDLQVVIRTVILMVIVTKKRTKSRRKLKRNSQKHKDLVHERV